VPEGHLAHRYATAQRPLVGHALEVSSPQGRFAGGAAEVDARHLDGIDAHGKHVLHRFDDRWIHSHLGMQKTWAQLPSPPPPPRPQARLRLSGPPATWDLFAPGTCELLDQRGVDDLLATLGPDPLRGDDPEPAWRRVRSDRRTIGEVVLDQSVVAGAGNVLRAEVLAAVGVDPRRPAATVDRALFDRIWSELTDRMVAAAASGSIDKHVYEQQTCRRCGTPIETFDLPRGRIAYRCPACQGAA
jgi:endonuclease-8